MWFSKIQPALVARAGGALSNEQSRNFLLNQVQGRNLPVPLVPGLSLQFNMTHEETGVNVVDLEERGLLTFFNGNELFTICHVFKVNEFEGEPKQSREGVVKWFKFDEIPFDNMWPDDKFWMRHLIEGRKFKGTFYFDEELKELLRHDVKVI